MDNKLMNKRFEIIKLLIQSGFTNNAYSLIEEAKKIFDFIETNHSQNYVYDVQFIKKPEKVVTKKK